MISPASAALLDRRFQPTCVMSPEAAAIPGRIAVRAQAALSGKKPFRFADLPAVAAANPKALAAATEWDVTLAARLHWIRDTVGGDAYGSLVDRMMDGARKKGIDTCAYELSALGLVRMMRDAGYDLSNALATPPAAPAPDTTREEALAAYQGFFGEADRAWDAAGHGTGPLTVRLERWESVMDRGMAACERTRTAVSKALEPKTSAFAAPLAA